jgi:two-component system phosphate regulon sensor histidine kinase PhoR
VKSHLFFKLLGGFLIIGLGTTIGVDFAARSIWQYSLISELTRNLEQKAQLIADLIEKSPSQDMQGQVHRLSAQAGARVTIIDGTGKVLADSESNPATMENHAARPEVAGAMRTHAAASSQRLSATVGIQYLYVAVPFHTGVLRLAYPLSELHAALRLALTSVIVASLAVLLVTVVLAGLYTRSISTRIEQVRAFAESIAAGDLTARVKDESGDELGQMAAALDKTARRLEQAFGELESSRNQMEAVLNSMQEAVLAVGLDQKLAWANGRMRQLLQGGMRVGAPLIETVRDPDVLRAIRQTMESREPATAKSQLVLPGRIFQINVAPMSNGGAVAVWQEITSIEQVEKTRRDFIANVSHELRTPLTSVQGYAETLAETVTEGDAKEMLEVIRKNAARMARLTEDLLALARVESGEDKLELRPVAPAALVQDALESATGFFGRDIIVDVSAKREVLADADKVHQLFLNLIENASRYGRSSRGITLGAYDDTGKGVFYVRDYGQGIPSEHLPRLFERFYRVDKARTSNSNLSTGLGLAIAKHIVLKHGGRIWVESELNSGSTFYFSLPGATNTN